MSFADEIRSKIQQQTPQEAPVQIPERAEIERSTIAEFEKLTEAVRQKIKSDAKSGGFDLKRRNNVIKGTAVYCHKGDPAPSYSIRAFMQGCGIEGSIQKVKSGGGFINDPSMLQRVVFKTFYPDIFKNAFRSAMKQLQQDGIKASFSLVLKLSGLISAAWAFEFPLEELSAVSEKEKWVDLNAATEDLNRCNLFLQYTYKFRF